MRYDRVVPGRIAQPSLAVLLLVALSLVGYGFLLAPGATLYSKHSDAIAYSLGAKYALHEAAHAPLWQSHQMSGGPLFTNPQALYFQPLHAAFFVLPPSAALGPTVYLHFLVAALVLFALARTLGLGVWPAAFVGACGLFNFKLLLAAYAGWLPILPSLVLSPLLLLCVVRLLERPSLAMGLSFAATSAMCLHAGHIQVVYYTTLGCALLICVRAWSLVRAGQSRRVRDALWLLVLGSVLALGISAYLVLPIVAEVPLLARSQATYDFFLSGHAATPSTLGTMIFPELLGTPLDDSYPGAELWEDAAYFGLVPLALALLAVSLRPRSPHVRALAGSLVLSVLLAIDTPLLRALWWAVPGLSMFHCPSRLLFVTASLGIVLSGFGLAALLERLREPRARAVAVAVLLVIVVGEGSFYARRYLQMRPSAEVLPRTDYAALLAEDRSLFRVAPVLRDTVNYGWAAPLGLSLVTGYEPYGLRHYATYFDLVTRGVAGPEQARAWLDLERIARPDLLDLLNVKYLLSPVPIRFPDGRYEPIAELPDQPTFTFYEGMSRRTVHVYRHRRPRPRAFFVDEVVGVADEREALSFMQSRPLDEVAVAELPSRGPARFAPDPGDRVRVVAASPGELELRTHSAERRFVVISEVWHPGFGATLDGAPLALHRTNYALLGAFVGPGSHTLSLRFRPLHFELARSLSLGSLGVFVLLGLLVLARTARLGRVTPRDP